MSEKWVDKNFWSPSTGEEGDYPYINCGKFENGKVIHLEQCLSEIIVMKERCQEVSRSSQLSVADPPLFFNVKSKALLNIFSQTRTPKPAEEQNIFFAASSFVNFRCVYMRERAGPRRFSSKLFCVVVRDRYSSDILAQVSRPDL